ncbi:MAG TPA: cation:proton antiporter [Terriglobales bacterium]|jgi:Kef-type K+ transport system membrane component KefB
MSTSLQILLFIALLIAAAKSAGSLAARLGLPAVLGELLAGVVLGPTALNIWNMHWLANSGGAPVASVFKVLADVGVVVLMFVAGLETDIHMARRALKPAFWSAAGGVLLPMAGGYALSRWAGFEWQQALFIGTILTATSVTITAQTLMNLNQVRSRSGSTILGAAVIDDVMGLIVLSLVIAISAHGVQGGSDRWHALTVPLAKMAACLAGIFIAGPFLARWIMRTAARMHGLHMEVAAALAIGFAMAFVAETLGGMAAITGSYLAGLFVASTPSHERVIEELRAMTNSFFGPLFLVSIGLDVNAWQLGSRLGFFIVLLLIAILGKVLGCGLGAAFSGFNRRDSLIVGAGMIPRGEVGLITASIGFAAGLVTRDIYAQAIVLVLITTLITPVLLRYAFPKEQMQASISETAAVEISV